MKDIAKKLLETSIYPTPDEFREITDTFMKENHEDFMKAFKRPDKWLIYYEKYVASHVCLSNFTIFYNLTLNLLKFLIFLF
jgi:hypothetical protein